MANWAKMSSWQAAVVTLLATVLLVGGGGDATAAEDFTVVEPNEIHLSNKRMRNDHRDTKLVFSINGAGEITKITTAHGRWTAKMADNTTIQIEPVRIASKRLSHYKLHWFGAGPSTDRELCFHYGRNNQSWYSTFEERVQRWPLDTSRNQRGKGLTRSVRMFPISRS